MKRATVVNGPWASPAPRAEWPAFIGELRPMHAFLLAFDLTPNADREEVFERLHVEHGFKFNALDMAWRNAFGRYVWISYVDAVGRGSVKGQRGVWSLNEAGRTRLAQLNAKMERRPEVVAAEADRRQRSLFDGGEP